MERPCDICAGYTDRGIASEGLVTCCKCRLSREHIYCMRKIPNQGWEAWVCEECTKEDGMLSLKPGLKGDSLPSSANIAHRDGRHLTNPRNTHNDSGWRAHSRRQKAAPSGKVMYLSNEEVQQLNSKIPTTVFKSSAPKSPLSRVHSPTNVTQPKRGRPPKDLNTSISEKFSPFFTAQAMTPRKRGRPPKMLSISKIIQKASTIHSQENWSPRTRTREHSIKEQPKSASVFSRAVETSTRNTEKVPNKLSGTPSSSRDPLLNIRSGGEASAAEHNQSDAEERDLTKFSSLHLYRSFLPALQSTWKGGFIIYDDATSTPAQLFGGFKAHLPSKANRKVLDFLPKMPPVLHATLFPRLHLWDDPFRNDDPALDDVGLYLFPDDNITSSRETHASLFEVMHTKNSVLRIYFDGADAAELLVYTSKQMRLDLLDTDTCLEMSNFLWGIFRPKGDGQTDMDVSAATVEMEVDLIGGKMVGNVDVVVPKDSSSISQVSPQHILTLKDMEVDMVGAKSAGKLVPEDPSTPGKLPEQPITPAVQQHILTLKDMEVDMVGAKMAGKLVPKDPSTPGKLPVQPITPAVQQLLRITKEKYPDYGEKLSALNAAIKNILAKSNEPKNSDTSAPSAMETTPALQQVKSETEGNEMVVLQQLQPVKLEND